MWSRCVAARELVLRRQAIEDTLGGVPRLNWFRLVFFPESRLRRKQVNSGGRQPVYVGEVAVLKARPLRTRCTLSCGEKVQVSRRVATHAAVGHGGDDAAAMCVVEHASAELKYRIFGYPRFLFRGRDGAQTEISRVHFHSSCTVDSAVAEPGARVIWSDTRESVRNRLLQCFDGSGW